MELLDRPDLRPQPLVAQRVINVKLIVVQLQTSWAESQRRLQCCSAVCGSRTGDCQNFGCSCPPPKPWTLCTEVGCCPFFCAVYSKFPCVQLWLPLYFFSFTGGEKEPNNLIYISSWFLPFLFRVPDTRSPPEKNYILCTRSKSNCPLLACWGMFSTKHQRPPQRRRSQLDMKSHDFARIGDYLTSSGSQFVQLNMTPRQKVVIFRFTNVLFLKITAEKTCFGWKRSRKSSNSMMVVLLAMSICSQHKKKRRYVAWCFHDRQRGQSVWDLQCPKEGDKN